MSRWFIYMRYRAKTICCSFFDLSFSCFSPLLYFFFHYFYILFCSFYFCCHVESRDFLSLCLILPKTDSRSAPKMNFNRKHCCLLHKYIYSIKKIVYFVEWSFTFGIVWLSLSLVVLHVSGNLSCHPLGLFWGIFCTFKLDWDTPGDKGLMLEHGKFEIFCRWRCHKGALLDGLVWFNLAEF